MSVNFNILDVQNEFNLNERTAKEIYELCKSDNDKKKHPLDAIAMVIDNYFSEDVYEDLDPFKNLFYGWGKLSEKGTSRNDMVFYLKRVEPNQKTFIWISRHNGKSDFYLSSITDLVSYPFFFDIRFSLS